MLASATIQPLNQIQPDPKPTCLGYPPSRYTTPIYTRQEEEPSQLLNLLNPALLRLRTIIVFPPLPLVRR